MALISVEISSPTSLNILDWACRVGAISRQINETTNIFMTLECLQNSENPLISNPVHFALRTIGSVMPLVFYGLPEPVIEGQHDISGIIDAVIAGGRSFEVADVPAVVLGPQNVVEIQLDSGGGGKLFFKIKIKRAPGKIGELLVHKTTLITA